MSPREAKWAERVSEWKRSGQTVEVFALERGLEVTTLRYWASRSTPRQRNRVPEALPEAYPLTADQTRGTRAAEVDEPPVVEPSTGVTTYEPSVLPNYGGRLLDKLMLIVAEQTSVLRPNVEDAEYAVQRGTVLETVTWRMWEARERLQARRRRDVLARKAGAR